MTIEKVGALPNMFDPLVTSAGIGTSDFYLWLVQVNKVLGLNTDATNAPVVDPEYELIEEWPVLIPVPDNQSYTLVLNSAVARTVTKVTTKCVSGSCTVTGKINTTALGGTANSASTSEQSRTHSSANEMAAGDDLVITISSNSSCRDLSINIHTTRTLTSS